MKLCKDCKYSVYSHESYDSGMSVYKCLRPVEFQSSLQDGKKYVRLHQWPWASIQRDISWLNPFGWIFGMCTSAGRFWEPKDDHAKT